MVHLRENAPSHCPKLLRLKIQNYSYRFTNGLYDVKSENRHNTEYRLGKDIILSYVLSFHPGPHNSPIDADLKIQDRPCWVILQYIILLCKLDCTHNLATTYASPFIIVCRLYEVLATSR
jgi:hypothetical protein